MNTRYEAFEILPLLAVIRAAVTSPEWGSSQDTIDGVVMLTQIIEERLLAHPEPEPEGMAISDLH